MKILKTLAKAANLLDKKGYFDEANMAEDLIENLIDDNPDSFPVDVFGGKDSSFQKTRVNRLVKENILPRLKAGHSNLNALLRLMDMTGNDSVKSDMLKFTSQCSSLFDAVELAVENDFQIYPEEDYKQFIIPAQMVMNDIRDFSLNDELQMDPDQKEFIKNTLSNAIESLETEIYTIEKLV